MTYLLGIDLGTSSVKAILFDARRGTVTRRAACEYPTYRPAPDQAEHDPADWWGAAVQAVRLALGDLPSDAIHAIGLCGHMHGAAFLDRAGRSVRPAIIWADGRSSAECAALTASMGADRYAGISGTLPAAGFAAPTLMWLNAHEPRTLSKTAVILPPKDALRYMLTGEIATDPSDAAATGLFDVSIKSWSPEIVGAVGIGRGLLPPVRDSAAVAGALTAQAAAALGIASGTPVVIGCADQPAQAFANGIIQKGRVSLTIGSGGQVFAPLAVHEDMEGSDFRLPVDARVHIFNHAVPGMWYALGATLSAGLSLRWLRDLLNMTDDPDAYARLSAEAADIAPGAGGLLFLPYLTGERTPHFDPAARGAFIGLRASHTRGHLARAIMEGVAFSMRQTLEIATSVSGAAETVIAAGGAMDSPVWRGIMTDVLGVPLRQTGLSDATGIGAALLAGVGTGIYETYNEACTRTSQPVRITEPNRSVQARYDALYARFVRLYDTLRDDMHALSADA
jgi:xylulokinase